jgi:hypothetical protein
MYQGQGGEQVVPEKIDTSTDKPTTTVVVDTKPKFFSGVSANITPEDVSVTVRDQKIESCHKTGSTVMGTISTSSKPESNDVLVVRYGNGLESNPTTAIIHRGTNLVDFLKTGNQNSIADSKLVIGSVVSYSKSIVELSLPDGLTKKVNTSDIPFFILNTAGIPSIVKQDNRVDINCSYKNGVWEADSITVFN